MKENQLDFLLVLLIWIRIAILSSVKVWISLLLLMTNIMKLQGCVLIHPSTIVLLLHNLADLVSAGYFLIVSYNCETRNAASSSSRDRDIVFNGVLWFATNKMRLNIALSVAADCEDTRCKCTLRGVIETVQVNRVCMIITIYISG